MVAGEHTDARPLGRGYSAFISRTLGEDDKNHFINLISPRQCTNGRLIEAHTFWHILPEVARFCKFLFVCWVFSPGLSCGDLSSLLVVHIGDHGTVAPRTAAITINAPCSNSSLIRTERGASIPPIVSRGSCKCKGDLPKHCPLLKLHDCAAELRGIRHCSQDKGAIPKVHHDLWASMVTNIGSFHIAIA